MVKNLQKQIHEANISVHRSEANYYELIHPEVYGKYEQKRIKSTLKMVDKLVAGTKKKALDVGAGTGNVTDKLLKLGYAVTAIDISAEMCDILRKKYRNYLETEKLVIINSPIEAVSFNGGEFDLITCYSVLHHLPDYVASLQRLSFFLKKGGVIYLDHEISPFYWKDEARNLSNLIKYFYFHSNPLLNVMSFKIFGIQVPSINYGLSDYWHQKEHPLDHKKIEELFARKNFDFFARTDYHVYGTWIFNPLFFLYKQICKPDMSFWIAKK